MKINKDMTIGALVREYPETIDVLFTNGMGCVGCPSSQAETLEQACMVHGISLESLLSELNSKLA